MARYVFIFLLSMVLPSMAITTQDLINRGRCLYEAILERNPDKINNMIQVQKQLRQDKLSLYKQARKLAKEKKDAQATQYLTEQILEQQKNFCERHYIISPLVAAAISGIISWRLATWFRIKNCTDGFTCVRD